MDATSQAAGRKPQRVLHVLRLPMGGLFRHVRDLVEGQQAAGIATGVICAEPPQDGISAKRLADLEHHCGLGLHVVPMSRMPGFGDLANLREVGRIARWLKPDVLHGHGAKGGLLARYAPCNGKVVRIYTPHGGTLHYSAFSPQGIAYLAAERMMRGRTDGFIFESEFSRTAYLAKVGKPGAPTAVIHNGLTRAEFAPVAPAADAADFLFIGELRMLKGVSTLIDAVGMLGRPVHLRIVGAGPDRQKFEAMARSMPAHVRIEFLGSMPAREAFALARAAVLPSWNESLPYVALEVAAAGMPLIATKVGGLPEIFGDEAERLVTPGDASALSAALAKCLAHPGDAAASAARLRARVEDRFSSERMVDAVCRFYRRLLDAKQPAPVVAGRHPLPAPSAASDFTGLHQ